MMKILFFLVFISNFAFSADTIIFRASASGHNDCGEDATNDNFFNCNYGVDRESSCSGLANSPSFQSVAPSTWFPLEYDGASCKRAGGSYLSHTITQITISDEHCSGLDSLGKCIPPTCTTQSECLNDARSSCESNSQILVDFNFVGVGNYSFSCGDIVDPEFACHTQIAELCSANWGVESFTYTDNGDGTNSCTGVCLNQQIVDTSNPANCTIENNYCDVTDDPSDIDFSDNGNADEFNPNIDISSPEPDVYNSNLDENSDLYNADLDATSGSTFAQSDKIISEIIELKNSNSFKSEDSAQAITSTIIAKSNDISSTISNSANGIIDAINDSTPFYDGNILNSLSDISSKIDSIGGDFSANTLPDKEALNSLFTDSDNYQSLISSKEQEYKDALLSFKNSLSNAFSINATHGEYSSNTLNFSKWGSYDVSVERFSEHFPVIRVIVIFMASLMAIVVVISGVRF